MSSLSSILNMVCQHNKLRSEYFISQLRRQGVFSLSDWEALSHTRKNCLFQNLKFSSSSERMYFQLNLKVSSATHVPRLSLSSTFFPEEPNVVERVVSFARGPTSPSKELNCIRCNKTFVMNDARVRFYAKNFTNLPKRCSTCNQKNLKRMASRLCPDIRRYGKCTRFEANNCRYIH